MLRRQQANGGSSSAAVENGTLPDEGGSWRNKGHSGLEDLRQAQAAEVEGLHIQDPRRYFERSSAVCFILSYRTYYFQCQRHFCTLFNTKCGFFLPMSDFFV